MFEKVNESFAKADQAFAELDVAKNSFWKGHEENMALLRNLAKVPAIDMSETNAELDRMSRELDELLKD